MKPERMHKKLPFPVNLSLALSVILLICGCRSIKKNEDLINSGIALPLKESILIDISVKSRYMEREMPCKIYFPAGYGTGRLFPVWYGLHGHSSTESMWPNAGITLSADKLIENHELRPLIMIFPFTKEADAKEILKDREDDGKFGERNMDRFISRELVSWIDSHYDTVKSAKDRYIGGLSMGGAIALRTAFHHPDQFSRVGGYSPALTSSDYSGTQLEKWLYPNDDAGKIKDVVKFAEKNGFTKLSVYLDAGNSNDPFSAGVQSLQPALEKRGIKSEFHLYEGGHSLEHNKGDFSAYLKFYAGRE